MSIATSSRHTSSDTTSSLAFIFMPRTPAAGPASVAAFILHAGATRRGAAHEPDVVLVEADGHAEAADDEDVVAAVGRDHPHELVTVTKVDGDDADAQRGVVLGELRLLH